MKTGRTSSLSAGGARSVVKELEEFTAVIKQLMSYISMLAGFKPPVKQKSRLGPLAMGSAKDCARDPSARWSGPQDDVLPPG